MVPQGQGAGKVIDPFNINVGEACSWMYYFAAVGLLGSMPANTQVRSEEGLRQIQCSPWRPLPVSQQPGF